ncbi:MAG: bifunctional 5,10-methylenetetrahydrofolate dehydrogenase/5,10-methenyltetrahydrofolate cyclohydrolase [Candidatus Paceibacterota bacterium]
MVKILDGKKVRDERKAKLTELVSLFNDTPTLVILQVGSRADSTAYIEQKKKFGAEIGVAVEVRQFPEDVQESDLIDAIEEANKDTSTHGIIVQLPLPDRLDTSSVIEAIEPNKDVDGLTAVNVKKLQAGDGSGFTPATAKGIGSLLDAYDIDLAGKRVVVVGRSALVGKPTASVMLVRDATVTIAHSKTTDLAQVTRQADVLIVATGRPKLIGAEHVREGQTVIDVGINLNTGESLEEEIALQTGSGKKFIGDVDFEAVEGIVSAISPVPGGVGPMTVLSLFENCIKAYQKQVEER